MILSLEAQTARAADERIAAKWGEYWDKHDAAVTAQQSMDMFAKAIAEAEKRGHDFLAEQYAPKHAAAAERYEAARAEMAAANDAAQQLDKELYTGWTRFYLVQHIHNTTHCSSFRYTTRVQWLPKVSGLTEVEAVSEYGETLCTKCFPDAPVALTVKAADPTICTGSRDHEAPSRTGYYSGNWAMCTEGHRVTLTSAGNLRKHKK